MPEKSFGEKSGDSLGAQRVFCGVKLVQRLCGARSHRDHDDVLSSCGVVLVCVLFSDVQFLSVCAVNAFVGSRCKLISMNSNVYMSYTNNLKSCIYCVCV